MPRNSVEFDEFLYPEIRRNSAEFRAIPYTIRNLKKHTEFRKSGIPKTPWLEVVLLDSLGEAMVHQLFIIVCSSFLLHLFNKFIATLTPKPCECAKLF
jgi:hypothetical protein